MTTIHAYTNAQKILNLPHSDFLRELNGELRYGQCKQNSDSGHESAGETHLSVIYNAGAASSAGINSCYDYFKYLQEPNGRYCAQLFDRLVDTL